MAPADSPLSAKALQPVMVWVKGHTTEVPLPGLQLVARGDSTVTHSSPGAWQQAAKA